MVAVGLARLAALANLLPLCSLASNASTGTCEAGEECPSDFDSLLQLGLRVERPAPAPALLESRSYYRQRLHNSGDVQYTGDLTLGGQRLRGILDTGSFEILAFAKSCGTCGMAAKYDAGESPTFIPGRLITTHSFGSGTCGCSDGSDALTLGPFVVERQDFWEVVKAQMPILATATFNAIIGLSPPGQPQLAVMDLLNGNSEDRTIADIVLQKNDSLVKNLGIRYFSACFEWAEGGPGYVIWNDKPPKDQQVHFRELEVSSTIYWKTRLGNPHLRVPEFREADKSISLGCPLGCDALLDTGTSLIAVPQATYDVVLRELNKLNRDCARLGEMPDLAFSLGGHTYSLPPQSYIGIIEGAIPDGFRAELPPISASEDIIACQLLLMITGSLGEELWILGMPFFRYYYTTFDLGEHPYRPDGRRIWTAPASPDCHPSNDSSHEATLSLARRQRPWRINGPMIRPPRHASQAEVRADLLNLHNFTERMKLLAPQSVSGVIKPDVRMRHRGES